MSLVATVPTEMLAHQKRNRFHAAGIAARRPHLRPGATCSSLFLQPDRACARRGVDRDHAVIEPHVASGTRVRRVRIGLRASLESFRSGVFLALAELHLPLGCQRGCKADSVLSSRQSVSSFALACLALLLSPAQAQRLEAQTVNIRGAPVSVLELVQRLEVCVTVGGLDHATDAGSTQD